MAAGCFCLKEGYAGNAWCVQLQEEIQDRLAKLQQAHAFQALSFEQAVAKMHELVSFRD